MASLATGEQQAFTPEAAVFVSQRKNSILNFHDLGLHKALLRTLEEAEHTTPTPIQEQAIPVVIDGHDVVGLAQTGTGKTAAFLLPLIHKQDRPNHKGKYRPIRVLVLSPTRELAAQIAEKARQFGRSMNLRSQLTVGGVPINKQMQQLSRGADILISTPGRLLDLVKRDAIQLDKVEALVLDEADHMLDIGFLPDVKRIIAQLPKERQTLLFSATMPKAIQDLAAQYLNDPVEISVARQSSVAENIDQSVKHMSGGLKPDALAALLQEHDGTRTVVFARTKHGADNIVRRLAAVNIDARAIHGNKSQGQRERAIKAFTRGDYSVLVATDIAARGIDIKDIGLVVNYELPDVPEVYVHRIGRTARAGAAGKAVSFCTSTEVNQLRGIERLIKMSIPAEGKIDKPAGGSKSKGKPKPKRASNRPGSKARKKPDFKPRGEMKKEADQSDSTTEARHEKRKDKPAGKKPFRKPRSENEGENRSQGNRSFDKKSSFKPKRNNEGDEEDNRRKRKPKSGNRTRGDRFNKDDGSGEGKRRENKSGDKRSDGDRSRSDKPRSKKPRSDKTRDDRTEQRDTRGGTPRNKQQKSGKPFRDRSNDSKSERSSSGGDRPRFKKSSGGKSNRGNKGGKPRT